MTEQDPEPIEDIVPRILKDYSDEPRGWRILSTPVGDMLVLGPTSTFQLKLIPLGPQKFTGAGVEISGSKKALKRIRQTPEFGLRPLSSDEMTDLLTAFTNPETSSSKLQTILSRTPLSHEDLTHSSAEHILSGPILTRPDFGALDAEILKRQLSLDRSASDVFRQRYPMRAGMYF